LKEINDKTLKEEKRQMLSGRNIDDCQPVMTLFTWQLGDG